MTKGCRAAVANAGCLRGCSWTVVGRGLHHGESLPWAPQLDYYWSASWSPCPGPHSWTTVGVHHGEALPWTLQLENGSATGKPVLAGKQFSHSNNPLGGSANILLFSSSSIRGHLLSGSKYPMTDCSATFEYLPRKINHDNPYSHSGLTTFFTHREKQFVASLVIIL